MGDLYKQYCKTYNENKNDFDEFFSILEGIYDSEEVQGLAIYPHHRDIDRLQHVFSVTYLTYYLSKKLNLDYKSATRAACMHDLFYYDWYDGKTGKWHNMHGFKHPYFAYLNAKELYPELNKIESDAIKKHMWPLTPAIPRYKESFVVSLSDKYCATREFLYSSSKKYKTRFLNDVKEVY